MLCIGQKKIYKDMFFMALEKEINLNFCKVHLSHEDPKLALLSLKLTQLHVALIHLRRRLYIDHSKPS